MSTALFYLSIFLCLALLLVLLHWAWKRWRLKPLDDTARKQAPGNFIQLSDGITHFQISREGESLVPRPLVVLVHGFSTPSIAWNGVVPMLNLLGYPTLTYDLFGRGWSDRPKARYDVAMYRRQLAELLTALRITEPVLLVGYSMGGLIATDFTATNPQSVAKLGLVAPAGLNTQTGNVPKILKAPIVGNWFMDIFAGPKLAADMDAPENRSKFVPDIAMQFRQQLQFGGYYPALLATLRNSNLRNARETYQKAAKTGIPIAAIWGGSDDVTPPEGAELLVEIAPDAITKILPKISHAIAFTEPVEVGEFLSDFFDDGQPEKVEIH